MAALLRSSSILWTDGFSAGTAVPALPRSMSQLSPVPSLPGLQSPAAVAANYIYAADNTGHIVVFDTNFSNVTGTTFAGKFVDPNPVAGFHPFNIQNIGGNLYVTYAAVTAQGVGLPGGFVDEFNSSGTFLKRIATNGLLNAPWGITLAPATFGSFGGDLLIGQFGDGQILAYDPSTDQFLGAINGTNGMPIVNPFLWALDFRTGGTNVNTNALYFTAGYNNQRDGLFGEIQSTPEAGTIALVLTGLSFLGARRLLRNRGGSRPETLNLSSTYSRG